MKRLAPVLALALVGADWPQFGGPQRNFAAAPAALAATWPVEGPRALWRRPLGEGYSAISVASSRLFTMYRRGEQEVVVALEAATGATAWEHAYQATFSSEYDMQHGSGPHATPLVAGGRVFATGATDSCTRSTRLPDGRSGGTTSSGSTASRRAPTATLAARSLTATP
jgi:outer membrane protein assembly factor BamB